MNTVPTIRREIIPLWQRRVEEIVAIVLAGFVFAAIVVGVHMFGNILTW